MFPLKRHEPLLTPESEIRNRIRILQSTLQKKEIHFAWFDHPADLAYYSGSAQKATLLVPAEGDSLYFVKKSVQRAAFESPLTVQPFPGRKGFAGILSDMLKPNASLGLSLDVTSAATFVWLTGCLPGVQISDISWDVRTQRAVKSPWEVEQIAAAAAKADRLFSEVPDLIKPGMTELELSGAIESRMRASGHGGVMRIRSQGSDLVILTVVSGDAALYPTNFDGPSGGEGPFPSAPAGAGLKRIQKGETVLVDMVTSHNGYFSDQTRIFFLGGQVPELVRQTHTFCLKVLKKLEEAFHPGQTCSDIYDTVDKWAVDHNPPDGFMGFGENRVKFFGHGVGLELDEFPIIADRMDLALAPGMVIAAEPKAYLPGVGGVGAENTYVVTESGCRSLVRTPLDIVPIVLGDLCPV